MNRFYVAAIVGSLFAATAAADTPPLAAPATAPVIGSTVPTPVVQNTLIEPPHRMGLFARMRARRTNPMLTTSAAFPAGPMVTSPMAPVPAPMPSTTPPPPAAGKTMTDAAPSITGMPVVAGTEAQMTPMTAPAKRMGLIARLRMRRS